MNWIVEMKNDLQILCQIYGLNAWFKSQYGHDAMTFMSIKYLNVKPFAEQPEPTE